MAKLKDGTRIYGNANIDSTLTTLDLVVTGNMTIQGTTTTVDSTITTIEDPVITLGTNATNDGLDRGLILQYNDGAAKTGFLGWDQSLGEFAAVATTTFTAANNSVVIGTYGNVHGLHFVGIGDTLSSITGANVTGTVNNANMSAYAGNVTQNAQANITSVGTLTGLTVGNATANTTFGNGTITAGGVVSITDASTATSNTSGALQVTGGAGIGGNLYVAGTIYGAFAGNISGNISAKGNTTEVQFNDAGGQNASPAFTFNRTGNLLTVSGTVTGGNLSTAGTLSVTGNANVGNLGTTDVVATGNISTGNATVNVVITSSTVTATANITGGNLLTAGNITGGNVISNAAVSTVTLSATGNISTTLGNITAGGNANITGTANVGNLTTGGDINGTGASSTANVEYLTVRSTANITSTATVGNLVSGGTANVTGNATVGNLSTAGRATVGNLTMSAGALVTGDLIPSANVTYDLGNSTRAWKDLYLSGDSIRLGTQTITSNADGVTLSNSINTTNITASNLISTLTLTASGAITGANVTANNLSNTQVAFADGSKIVGDANLTFTSTTGTLSANLFTGTLTTNAQPNITSVGTLTDLTVTNVATANINGYAATVSSSAQSNITSLGTLTGLVVSGNIQSNANVITDNILAKGINVTVTAGTDGNIVLAPQGTGTVDVSSKRITGLATPTQATDAATKGYVDASSQGLDIKNSVRAATTTNITLEGTQTVDGVVLVAGDRVLVKNQTNATQNGIYVVGTPWTRAIDADVNGELTAGSFTFVEEGTYNNDSGWVISTNGEIVIGTDDIAWTQFSGTGAYSASDGVQLIGTNFSANVDNSTIAVVSGALKVKDGLTLVTPNIGVATGTSLDLTGNLTAGNATFGGASGGSISGANVMSANYFTGTLTTAAQPNITSVGTLSNLNVATTLNVATNAFIANASGIYTDGYYYANGAAIDFQTAAGDATEIQFKATGSNNLAASNNFTFNASSNTLTVTGTANISGNLTAGNIITASLTSTRIPYVGVSNNLTDTTNLVWDNANQVLKPGAGGTEIGGDSGYGYVKTTKVTAGSLTSGRVTFAGTDGLLSDDADLQFDTLTNELKSGNANVAVNMTAGNVTSRNLTSGRITFATAGGLLSDNANLLFNTTGNILTVDSVTSSGNVSAGQFIGNGVQLSNVAGGNVSGQVGNALLAGTVYTNAQPNITSVGSLTGLTVTGLATLDSIANVRISGGTNGQIISTDGNGILSFISNDTGTIVNGTSNVSIPTVNGNIIMVQGGTTVLTVTGVGANITGTLDVTGNISGNHITATNTITASANTDATTSITGTIKVTGGMAATGNIYTGKSVGFANNNGGTASKAYIQFNDTANSLDFIFN